jgi:signal transduction histidine kinase
MAGAVVSSRHPMCLWWGSELIQLYNDAFRPALGEKGRHPQALGMPARAFWAGGWDALEPQIERVMTAGEASSREDQRVPIERAGRLEDAWWTYSYSPVRDDDGSIGGTLLVCAETTRRVLADRLAELEHALRVAAEANARAREEVLGIVAHDLGNPLAAIDIAATALLLDAGSPGLPVGAHRTLAAILHAVRSMNRLIRDLTDVAGIQVGRLALELHEVAPAAALEAAAELFTAPARDGGVTLELQVSPGLPAVRADPDRLLQALGNLVANALKFGAPGGRITLCAERRPAGVRLSVQDTGPGIAADDLPHVFDRYWQKRPAGGQRGTGLGLAIVRGIVEAHGGTIDVESTLGEGSQFSFTIPASN